MRVLSSQTCYQVWQSTLEHLRLVIDREDETADQTYEKKRRFVSENKSEKEERESDSMTSCVKLSGGEGSVRVTLRGEGDEFFFVGLISRIFSDFLTDFFGI